MLIQVNQSDFLLRRGRWLIFFYSPTSRTDHARSHRARISLARLGHDKFLRRRLHVYASVSTCLPVRVIYTRRAITDVNGGAAAHGAPRPFLLAWNLRLYRRQRSIINPGAIKPLSASSKFPVSANKTERRVARRLYIFTHPDVCYRKEDLSPPSSRRSQRCFEIYLAFIAGIQKYLRQTLRSSLLVQKLKERAVLSFLMREGIYVNGGPYERDCMNCMKKKKTWLHVQSVLTGGVCNERKLSCKIKFQCEHKTHARCDSRRNSRENEGEPRGTMTDA